MEYKWRGNKNYLTVISACLEVKETQDKGYLLHHYMQNKLRKGYSDRDIIGWQRNGDVRGEENVLKTYFL